MAGDVTVTVNHGWAVAADGKQHSGGQTVNVDQDTADRWIASGWATAVDTTAKPPAKTSRPTTGRQRRP